MWNANVLACYASNVGIVWFYTPIIPIVFTVFIYTYYFVISPVTGSSDLLEMNKIQYNATWMPCNIDVVKYD